MNEITNHETGEIMMGGRLAAALASAQGEMQNAAFNQTNPHYKSKYADLAAIRDATIPALSKHGLAITQKVRVNGNGLLLITTLRHSSGEYEESEWPIPFDKPQVMGSAMTYGRRYSWAAMCGIASEQDDDGNEGQKGNKPTPSKRKPADVEEIERQQAEMDREARDAIGPPPPHLIKLPQTGDEQKNWGQWTGAFLNALKACKTLTEFDAWTTANIEMTDNLGGWCADRADDCAGWHERLKKDVKALRDKFGAGEP